MYYGGMMVMYYGGRMTMYYGGKIAVFTRALECNVKGQMPK